MTGPDELTRSVKSPQLWLPEIKSEGRNYRRQADCKESKQVPKNSDLIEKGQSPKENRLLLNLRSMTKMRHLKLQAFANENG